MLTLENPGSTKDNLTPRKRKRVVGKGIPDESRALISNITLILAKADTDFFNIMILGIFTFLNQIASKVTKSLPIIF